METNKVPVRTVPSRTRRARPAPPPAAEAFFRADYRKLLAIAMYVGATKDEAEDAVESVIIDMLYRWEEIRDPLAYARKAVVHNFIKQKTRSRRLIRRLIEFGEWASGLDHDPEQQARLTIWENRQWVMQLLNSLPPRQREVMAYVVDELSPTEVAHLLGKDPAAVRQTLMAARQRLKPAFGEQRNSAGERRPDEHH